MNKLTRIHAKDTAVTAHSIPNKGLPHVCPPFPDKRDTHSVCVFGNKTQFTS